MLALAWPNDGSLWRGARLLERELQRAGAAPDALAAGHSAGGLVLRTWAQCLGGAPARLATVGTPHGGSELAPLAVALELSGLPNADALRRRFADGGGQLRRDLRPGSLALLRLDRCPPPACPVLALRGRLPGATRWAAASVAWGAGLRALAPRLRAVPELVPLAAWLEQQPFPPQLSAGDGAVACAAATPGFACREREFPLDHLRLMHDPAVLDALAEFFTASAP